MVKIVIENLGKKEVQVTNLSLSVLHLLQAEMIDWMHACGGKGRCTTCSMLILDGAENMTPLSPSEIKYRTQGALGKMERLTCQTRITGSIRISVPDENKLPHVRYSE